MSRFARVGAMVLAVGAAVVVGAAPVEAQTTLRIATEGVYAPWSYKDARGNLVGWDIEIASALCAKMQAKCEIAAQDWDGIIPGLLAKKFDAIVAGMSMTPARRERVAFTNKYKDVISTFVAKKGTITVWAARGSRSAVILDLDGDGDLDVVTASYNDIPGVLVSDLAQKGPVHHITVRLVGSKANRDGLGAQVTVVAGGRAQLQVHDGKSGYLGQSSLPLYVGLGAADHADEIRVRWPGGSTQKVKGPFASGAAVVVEQPR